MDPEVSLDAKLIHKITSLLVKGEDPTLLFGDKRKDRVVAAQIFRKYGTTRGARGWKVAEITDQAVKFGL